MTDECVLVRFSRHVLFAQIPTTQTRGKGPSSMDSDARSATVAVDGGACCTGFSLHVRWLTGIKCGSR